MDCWYLEFGNAEAFEWAECKWILKEETKKIGRGHSVVIVSSWTQVVTRSRPFPFNQLPAFPVGAVRWAVKGTNNMLCLLPRGYRFSGLNKCKETGSAWEQCRTITETMCAQIVSFTFRFFDDWMSVSYLHVVNTSFNPNKVFCGL